MRKIEPIASMFTSAKEKIKLKKKHLLKLNNKKDAESKVD